VTGVTDIPAALDDTGSMSQAIAVSTVGEWAAKSLRVVLILEGYGIEHHAEEAVPLDEACRKRGLDPAKVQGELEAAASFRKAVEANWAEMPLDELIRHIQARHHEYLKLELPRLRARLNKMSSKHGERDNRLLLKLHAVFCGLQEELDLHLRKEEMILFPLIEQSTTGVANPIAMTRHEHDSAMDALAKIREITRNFDPPAYACPNFKGVYVSLQELEEDLKEHIRLENEFLFPRAESLEKRLPVN
jgi:regulator of cell morphogenesis and NO signaling